MMKSLSRVLFLFVFIAACEFVAVAQDCATVTLVGSAVARTTVTAKINIVNCRGDATSGFVDASVNTLSSNTDAARPASIAKLIGTDGVTNVEISAQQVTTCTPVTLTFAMRFKVQKIDGSLGPREVKTVTRTLMVCPFRFDLQVLAVTVTPAPAGQDSEVKVTLVNQGAQTPRSSGSGPFKVNLTIVEDTSGLVRNSCSATSAPILVGSPQLRSGEQQTLIRSFKFPQAGAFTLKAEVSLFESEDGPTDNNSGTQAVTVPLPRPLVCEIRPLTAKPGDLVQLSGNWFRTFGTTETPTVKFGNVQAQVVRVTSPLEMTVRMPELEGTNSSQMIVTVVNATGATVVRAATGSASLLKSSHRSYEENQPTR